MVVERRGRERWRFEFFSFFLRARARTCMFIRYTRVRMYACARVCVALSVGERAGVTSKRPVGIVIENGGKRGGREGGGKEEEEEQEGGGERRRGEQRKRQVEKVREGLAHSARNTPKRSDKSISDGETKRETRATGLRALLYSNAASRASSRRDENAELTPPNSLICASSLAATAWFFMSK